MTKGRVFWLLAGFGPLLFAGSCVSSEPKPAALVSPGAETGTLTYWCSDGGSLRVERLAGGVRLAGVGAESVELPAAPAGQESRYSQEPYTLVLDGKDALFVKNGGEPLACTR